jgi:hypothetical protein
MKSPSRRWSTSHSDLTALMVSGLAAAVAPMPTFLLAYTLLGPIHYLTEMQWLRKKSFYFRTGVIPPWMYGTLAAALALLGALDYVLKAGYSNWIVTLLLVVSISATLRSRYALAAVAVAVLAVRHFSPTTIFLVGVFTPSLVHVFVFTWFFMMSGALRAKTVLTWRWGNPLLLLAIPLVLLWLPIHYAPQGGLWLRLNHDSFEPMHQYIMQHLRHGFVAGPGMLNDPLVAGMLRVFAFMYLFHYLNWFGKMDLLQWNAISQRGWTAIGVMYAGSISLYAWNFRVGFLVTNFLGLLHVLLEFPLDWQAMRFVLLRGRPTKEVETVREPTAGLETVC